MALEAALRGHAVYAQDIDPWAALGVATTLGLPPSKEIEEAAERLAGLVADLVEAAYATTFSDGEPAHILHTMRVAVGRCPGCRRKKKLFPYALLSRCRRRERHADAPGWLACPVGHVFLGPVDNITECKRCKRLTCPEAAYTKNRLVQCNHCERVSSLADWAGRQGFAWNVVLVERARGLKREISKPTRAEIRQAEAGWVPTRGLGVIPKGQETRVLLRHGLRRWQDMYPLRQRVVLETLLRQVPRAAGDNLRLRDVLSLAVVGAAEMAGMMSRWDRHYLKSYEAMAAHRYNLTTFAAEPNVWGIKGRGRGTVLSRLEAAATAARWLLSRKPGLRVAGPVSVRSLESVHDEPDVQVVCGSSEALALGDSSVDVIWTDPPYHDDLVYHDLSAPFRAWSRLGSVDARSSAVAIGGDTARYERVLRRVFTECRRVLKPNGSLLLTFANREPDAWISLFRALRSAGFRSRGFEIVSSDAEHDHAKRGPSSSSMDIILDLTASHDLVKPHRPVKRPTAGEAAFLFAAGEAFLASVKPDASENWEEDIRRRLKLRLEW